MAKGAQRCWRTRGPCAANAAANDGDGAHAELQYHSLIDTSRFGGQVHPPLGYIHQVYYPMSKALRGCVPHGSFKAYLKDGAEKFSSLSQQT
mmetsp:Transcript_37514/g.86572  ORF Transcript_37514/g.86572 Transcript_37514/m.86572 type:complete len:92 (+) Transcript_37514:1566-1841(+)